MTTSRACVSSHRPAVLAAASSATCRFVAPASRAVQVRVARLPTWTWVRLTPAISPICSDSVTGSRPPTQSAVVGSRSEDVGARLLVEVVSAAASCSIASSHPSPARNTTNIASAATTTPPTIHHGRLGLGLAGSGPGVGVGHGASFVRCEGIHIRCVRRSRGAHNFQLQVGSHSVTAPPSKQSWVREPCSSVPARDASQPTRTRLGPRRWPLGQRVGASVQSMRGG